PAEPLKFTVRSDSIHRVGSAHDAMNRVTANSGSKGQDQVRSADSFHFVAFHVKRKPMGGKRNAMRRRGVAACPIADIGLDTSRPDAILPALALDLSQN